MFARRDVGTKAREDFRRRPSATLSSSLKFHNGWRGLGRCCLVGGKAWIMRCSRSCMSGHEAVALRSQSSVESVRVSEAWFTWKTCVLKI